LINISQDEQVSIITALFALILLLAPGGAIATTQQVRTNIYATMTDERFGGCMAQIKVPYQLNCPTDVNGRSWVTFGCTGQLGDSWTAREAFKQAQLALLDDKQLTLVVTDTKKLGNQCYASRTIYTP
jgi:hypothetical protein